MDPADEHWSLAGQQEKFALAQLFARDGRAMGWAEAKGSAATTHILKPGIGRLHHQVDQHEVGQLAQFTVWIMGAVIRDDAMHLWRFDDSGLLCGMRHYPDTAKHLAVWRAAG